jgi:hypothetical protein
MHNFIYTNLQLSKEYTLCEKKKSFKSDFPVTFFSREGQGGVGGGGEG